MTVLMDSQSDVDTVIRVNSTMKLDAKSAGGAVPQPVQRRVDNVCTGWAAVQSLAMLLQAPSASFYQQPGTVALITRCSISSIVYFLVQLVPTMISIEPSPMPQFLKPTPKQK